MKKIERFICLKATTFTYSYQPLDADDLLRVIKSKLDLTVYTDEECIQSPRISWRVLPSLGGTTT
jgi:hypothetical protein